MSKMNKKRFGTKSYVIYILLLCGLIRKAWIAWNKLKYLKKNKNEDLKIAITSYKQIWKLSHKEYFKLHEIIICTKPNQHDTRIKKGGIINNSGCYWLEF